MTKLKLKLELLSNKDFTLLKLIQVVKVSCIL